VYLRQQPRNGKNGDDNANKQATKSLTLVSSVAGFTEAPGLAVYSAGKHGVYGLMRALRKSVVSSNFPFAFFFFLLPFLQTQTLFFYQDFGTDWKLTQKITESLSNPPPSPSVQMPYAPG
jgi:hypothetical protein